MASMPVCSLICVTSESVRSRVLPRLARIDHALARNAQQSCARQTHLPARPMPTPGYVYILASRRNGTLYTGVTSDLISRVWKHRHRVYAGFTAKYGVHRLVYFEHHEDISSAIHRETQIKKWRRRWKLELIENFNPRWDDLYEALVEARATPRVKL